MEEKLLIDIEQIKKLLPHRYPFLMVDRVLEYEVNKHLRAIKNVTVNEAHFNGHFPDFPVMPGVLIIEALAQAGGLLINLSHQAAGLDPKVYFLASVDNARFKGMVRPGDQLVLEATATRVRAQVCTMTGIAKVDGKVICSADIMCMTKN